MIQDDQPRFLEFPNDADGDSLRLLVENGSDLTKVMEIDFAMLVPREDLGIGFANFVSDFGFKTSVDYDEKYDCWTCYCSKVMVPLYDSIIHEQKWLAEAGLPFQAKPDGWGTFGNAT